MIYGAMLAGGSGTRVKSSKIPKQFIEIGGKGDPRWQGKNGYYK